MEQQYERILCFGDSNTYGYDPRDPFGGRYPPSERWPEILAENTGRDVVNMGLNGRPVPHSKREVDLALTLIRKELPADLVILLLGSNDAFLLNEPSAEEIASRMDTFLRELKAEFPALPVFLISPPPVEIPLAHMQEIFWDLIPLYRRLAARHGALFAAAPSWNLLLSADGVHFSPEAHREFAAQVEKQLREYGTDLKKTIQPEQFRKNI